MPRLSPAHYSFALFLFVASACDDRATTIAALKARESEWVRDISRLRATTAQLQSRLERARPSAGPRETATPILRVDALIRATGVGLGDIERIAQQSEGRIEAALRTGRDDGLKELDAASSRVSGALTSMQKQLEQAAADVAALERQVAAPGLTGK